MYPSFHASFDASVMSPGSCLALGFNSEVLQCQSCEIILRTVQDKQLYDDCSNCCLETTANVDNEEKYELIVLEIDKRIIYPGSDIAMIVKKKKDLGLTVKYRMGARPYLHLYRSKGDTSPADSMFVGSWSKDTFEEYLKANLLAKI